MVTNTQPTTSPNREAERGPEKPEQNGGISLLEWIIAAIGLAILVGVIGFLLWHAMQDRGHPPSLVLAVEAVAAMQDGYVVEIIVTNEGDKTAAAVTILGQLMEGDTVVEEREMTLDYVPPKSARRGGLFFTHDPAAYTLTLAPVGYQQP